MITEGFTEKLTTSDDSYEAGEHLTPFPSEAALLQNGQPQLLAQAETQQGATQQGAEAVATTTATQPGEQTVVAENNIVKLPAGTSIENIELDGNNIVLTQPDGSRVVIENAALHVPTFVIDDVEIPQEALVAALEANNINVAAGPDGTLTATAGGNTSGGGNFSEAIPGIGDAGPAIDLLPPTALQFGTLDQELLFPALDKENEAPSIGFPNTNGGSDIAIGSALVDEAGLANGTDPDGAQDPTLRATTTGTFRISDPDGLDDIASLTINGQTISIGGLVGSSIAGTLGTLTITAYDTTTGVVSYGYTLTSPFTSAGPNSPSTEQDKDIFSLTVTDQDGLNASATLNVDVTDDGPRIVSVSANTATKVTLDEGDTNAGVAGTSTPTTLVPNGYTAGDDLDVAGQGYIARATSGAAALINVSALTGADGPNTGDGISYKLSVVAGGASGVKLTDGTDVTLVKVSDTLVLGVVNGTTAAFAISMDADTGVVTVEQYLSLQHGDIANYDEPTSLTNGALSVIATVTDGDGDTAISSAVSVGSQIVFEDDGPRIVSVSANTATKVTLDEGDTNAGVAGTSTPTTLVPNGYTAGDDLDVAGQGYIARATSGAAALINVSALTGADGPNTGDGISYKLSVVAGGASGVKLTDGTDVTLVKVSDTLVLGVVNGTTAAFAISMDADTGVVTVEQYLSLQHGDIANYDEPTSLTNGALSVIATVTDGDGDTAISSAVSVGSQIVFEDDGPAPGPVTATPQTFVLDESRPLGTDTASGALPGGRASISASLSASFAAASFGADGAATLNSVVYSLIVAAGTQSGLFALDPSDKVLDADGIGQGNAILLYVSADGKTITGSTAAAVGNINAGNTYFRITATDLGLVTFTQLKNIWHPTPGTASYDEGASITASISLTRTLTDGDGDKASSTLTLGSGTFTIQDSGPSYTGATDGIIGNIAGQVEGTITGSFGSDGPGSILLSALNTPSGVTVSGPQATPDGGMQIVATTSVNNVPTTFYTMTWYQDGRYVFDLVTPRPTTTVANLISNSASGNYDVLNEGNGIIFDGLQFNPATHAITNNNSSGESLNVSTGGFGVGGNLIGNPNGNNDGVRVTFANPISTLNFDVNFQNNGSPATIFWQAYSNGNPVGSMQSTTVTGVGVVPVVLSAGGTFDRIDIEFATSKQNSLRVENFSLTRTVVPGDTSLNFGVTYTDADGDQVVGSTTVDSQVINILLAGNTTTTFTGDAGSDWFTGTSAAETFVGNGGVDTVDYSGSNAAVIVNLGDALTETGGHAAGDTLTNISNILGSNQADTITGSSGNNLIEGGAGADTLNGGTGIDTVSYAHSSVGVTVDLGIVGPTAQSSPGDASGDQLTGFENILGSAFNDTLTGDINDNLLMGGAGDDQLHGGGGSDRLVGGDGFDRLWGDGGNDVFVLDGSNLTVADTIEDYVLGDEVDLTALLDGVAAANIGNYVKVEEVGPGAADVLKVNTAGTGLAADFVTVAHLDANAGVKILYNDENHTNQHTTI
ncbi:DUF5801 repeats-in-toxin domain-containing protein [Shinella sp. G-2]|uniref:DUF5801 repeats-in-toxin domain-containing protein n=1 Tax=Shinella sp. G-2 TaxID=3133141 RepID=UPI003D0240A1